MKDIWISRGPTRPLSTTQVYFYNVLAAATATATATATAAISGTIPQPKSSHKFSYINKNTISKISMGVYLFEIGEIN